MPWQLELMTFGEIDEYLEQMTDVLKANEDASRKQAVSDQRRDQRQRLGLGNPPTFRHRS